MFIIAEIGINHNGSLDNVFRLIDMAKQAGCDAVKFQKRTIDLVYTEKELNSDRVSPWGTTFRAQKEALELSRDDYNLIDAYCLKSGIQWSASAWDIKSQDFLRSYNLPFNKVASAMGTNLDFVKHVAAEKKKTYVSTGMMELQDIDNIVSIFKEASCPLILMHTVSTYPANEEDLNLSLIPLLSRRYDLPVGYSGHEISVSPSLVAAALGAVCIERHITLDRAMYGSDQPASLELPAIERLVSMLRKLPIIIGDGTKRIIPLESLTAKKLRYWVS